MAITIKEMLMFPVFKDAVLQAGKNGESKVIRWVTILEVLDEIDRLETGELLITTAFDLSSNSDLCFKLIKKLVERNLAGLVIQTGYYLETIPEELLQEGEKYDFPIIEVPRTTTFSEITKHVHKQIISKQFEKIQYSEEMYKRLTDIALNNEGLQPLLDLTGNLIHGKMQIFDANFNELCSAVSDVEDEVIETETVLEQIHRYREEFQKGVLVSKSLQVDSCFLLIVPIKAKNNLYGFLVCSKNNEDFNEFEQIAIHHAATICTLEFIKLSSLEEKDNKLKADFLELVLSGDYSDELTVYSRGEALGYRIGSFDTCVAIVVIDQADKQKEIDKLEAGVVQTTLKVMQEYGLEALVKLFSGHSVFLITNRFISRVQIMDVFEKISEQVQTRFGVTISVGIGNYYKDFNEYKYSYKEAQEAIFILQSVWKKNKCLHVQDLGLYRLLLPILQDQEMISRYHHDILGDLIHNAELLETLTLYLEHIHKMNEVADKLFIHRHTLKYRLKKIEEATNKKITSFQDRVELELALIIHKTLYGES